MKIICVCALVVVISLIGGCSEQGWSDTMTGSRVVARPQPIQYSGPKVAVIVAQIENRTGSGTEIKRTGTTVQTGTPLPGAGIPEGDLTIRDPIGSGMRDQLITALTQTGVFAVLRTPVAGDTGARYLMEGAVTEYEPSQASVAGGFGWGTSKTERVVTDPIVSPGAVTSIIGLPSGIGGLFQQDHIAMSIHIVDLETNVIIDSATIEAKPKDLGAAMSLLFGGGTRLADVGGQVQTPMQKAIRACMIKTAHWAANTVIYRTNQQ